MGPEIVTGLLLGFLAWFVVSCMLSGFYTVDQNQRAVKTSFGRAQRGGHGHHAAGSDFRIADR